MEKGKLLVVSSHALDYLWRAGGTIHHYVRLGWQVRIITLTFGERGESDALWQSDPEMTEALVKAQRRKDSMKAAEMLGVSDIRFFDWGDYPLVIDSERLMQLTKEIKSFAPDIILTQFSKDLINFDHSETAEAVFKAVRYACVAGIFPQLPPIKTPQIFMYEPSHTEFFGFNPDVYLDITEEMDVKRQAMHAAAGSQSHLVGPYELRATYRGRNARYYSSDKAIRNAEAFVRFMPYVGREF